MGEKITILKVRTHIVTKVFKLPRNYIIIRLSLDFGATKDSEQSTPVMERISEFDMIEESGIGVNIHGYIQSGSVNLTIDGNIQQTRGLTKQIFDLADNNSMQYESNNLLQVILDQLLIYDDIWAQQKLKLLKIMKNNLVLDSDCLRLKNTNKVIFGWVKNKFRSKIDESFSEHDQISDDLTQKNIIGKNSSYYNRLDNNRSTNSRTPQYVKQHLLHKFKRQNTGFNKSEILKHVSSNFKILNKKTSINTDENINQYPQTQKNDPEPYDTFTDLNNPVLSK